jgi:hypothetical protein
MLKQQKNRRSSPLRLKRRFPHSLLVTEGVKSRDRQFALASHTPIMPKPPRSLVKLMSTICKSYVLGRERRKVEMLDEELSATGLSAWKYLR